MNIEIVLGIKDKRYKSFLHIVGSFFFLKSKHLFLTVLEAGKSKIKVLADPVSGETLLGFAGSHPLVSSHGGGQREGCT